MLFGSQASFRCVFVFLGLCVSVNTDGSQGGDGHPPADSQRANYRIIRREREGGHMCDVSATPTTHAHTPVTAERGSRARPPHAMSVWGYRSKKRSQRVPLTYSIPPRRC